MLSFCLSLSHKLASGGLCASFLTRFDIPVRLGCLLQGIASGDDRFDLARLNEFLEGNEIFCTMDASAQITFFLPAMEVQII